MYEVIVGAIASILAGVGTGFAGLSAAVFIAPMLTVFLDVEPYTAIGIALASDVLASAASAVTYAKHKNIDIKNGKALAVSVVFFTVIGSVASWLFTSLSFGNDAMTYWMVAATVCLGLNFLLRSKSSKEKKTRPQTFSATIISILGGAYIGVLCGFQGTGGGLLMLFVLNVLLGFEFKTAVGTSVLIMSITALIGAISHFAINGLKEVGLLILCVVVTLISAEVAAVLANRISPKALKRLTGTLMLGSGVIMMLAKII